MTDFKHLPPECDPLCEWRHCLRKGEDKGSFVHGQGYVSYHKTPKHVCLTRHVSGCPDGPVNGRPSPDWGEFIEAIGDEMGMVKCTAKTRRVMKRMQNLIIQLSTAIEAPR